MGLRKNIETAQKTFEEGGTHSVDDARNSINMGNWHFIRSCESIEILVSVIIDFLRILDRKIFRNAD